VWSYPGLGTWLLGVAWALGPIAVLAERYGRRRSRTHEVASGTVGA
jgi:hypothetical protein